MTAYSKPDASRVATLTTAESAGTQLSIRRKQQLTPVQVRALRRWRQLSAPFFRQNPNNGEEDLPFLREVAECRCEGVCR